MRIYMNYKAFFISLYILTNIMNIEGMELENTIPQEKIKTPEEEAILYSVSILNSEGEEITTINIKDKVIAKFSYFNNMIENLPQISLQENFVSLKTLEAIIVITEIYLQPEQGMLIRDALSNFTAIELITLIEALNYLGVNPKMLQKLLPEFSFFLISKFLSNSSFSEPTDPFYFLYKGDTFISPDIIKPLLIPIEERLSLIFEQKLITKHKPDFLSIAAQGSMTPLSINKNGSMIIAHATSNDSARLFCIDIINQHNTSVLKIINKNFIIDYHPIISYQSQINKIVTLIASSQIDPQIKGLGIYKVNEPTTIKGVDDIFSFALNSDESKIIAAQNNNIIAIDTTVFHEENPLNLTTLYTHKHPIVTIALSPNDQIIALLDNNGMLYLYSLTDQKIITQTITPLAPGNYNEEHKPYLAFNATGSSLLLSTNPKNTNPSIITWDIKSDNTLEEISRLSVDNNIISAAWSPDGKNIALLMPDKVSLYQIKSTHLIHTFKINAPYFIDGKSTSFVEKQGNLFLFIPSTTTDGSFEPSLALLSSAQERIALSNLLALQNPATEPKLSLLAGLILHTFYTEKSAISDGEKEVLKQLSFQSRNFLSQLDDQLYFLKNSYFNQVRNLATNSFAQANSIINYLTTKFNSFNWKQKAATGTACVGAACVLGAFAYKRLLNK